MTQTEWILSALERGPLTAMDALNGCGCFRLASRVCDLRQAGHQIETTHITIPSGKVVAQYTLKERKAA